MALCLPRPMHTVAAAEVLSHLEGGSRGWGRRGAGRFEQLSSGARTVWVQLKGLNVNGGVCGKPLKR